MTAPSSRPADQIPSLAVPEAVDARSGPVYIGDGHRLFAWYHAPVGIRRDCGIVICNPLGYEELCAHRALRHWADEFSEAGFPTLRFDYDGTGNSMGSDRDAARVMGWVTSIEEAAAALRARSGVRHIALLGIRLGGTLAVAAAERAGADALMLLAAPATGRAFAREVVALGRLMRASSNEASGEASETIHEVAGFTIMPETMADLARLDPAPRVTGVRRALVIPRDDVAGDTGIADRLVQRGVDVERIAVPGYAAMMVDAHESVPPQGIIDASVQWLTSHYASAVIELAESAPLDFDLVPGPGDEAVRESAVTFGEDRQLFGVLSESAMPGLRCSTGVILASAGSVHNVGPGRAYVELARSWAALGFSVFRMDIGGLGDSGARFGAIDNHPYPDHAVEDIAAAARWLIDRGRVERVVVAGLCSGAHASLHAGREVHGVDGIIVINPIVFYWNPACALDVSAWMNYYESRHYSRSVREVESWVKLVRGQVNVRYAASVAYRRMREVASGAATTLWQRLGLRGVGGEDVATDLKRISGRGVDVLLVFSEGDPGLDFVRRRYSREMRLLERERENFAMRVIPDADHTFSRRDARSRLAGLLTTHLMSRHRGGIPTGRSR